MFKKQHEKGKCVRWESYGDPWPSFTKDETRQGFSEKYLKVANALNVIMYKCLWEFLYEESWWLFKRAKFLIFKEVLFLYFPRPSEKHILYIGLGDKGSIHSSTISLPFASVYPNIRQSSSEFSPDFGNLFYDCSHQHSKPLIPFSGDTSAPERLITYTARKARSLQCLVHFWLTGQNFMQKS